MRIVIVISAPIPPREGIGFYAWNLAIHLTRLGHKVHLITRGTRSAVPPQSIGGITIWRPVFLPLYPLHAHIHGIYVNFLLKYLDLQVDLYHLHSPLVAVPSTNKPILITVHTPMQADVHSFDTINLSSVLAKLQLPASRNLECRLFKRANAISAVAISVAAELGEYGIDPSQVKVVGNGTDIDLFKPTLQHSSTMTYILTAGRLGFRKGLIDLLECARIVVKDFPLVQFWIAGEGPMRKQLERRIRELDMSQNVHLLGHIFDRQKMVELYQGASVYVHPAHYEGLPTVLLEAMACGRPVVSTSVSGSLDVIKNRENGLLVPPHTPQLLASSICELLENPTLSENLGRHARQTVLDRFSWEIITKHYVQIYQRMCEPSIN